MTIEKKRQRDSAAEYAARLKYQQDYRKANKQRAAERERSNRTPETIAAKAEYDRAYREQNAERIRARRAEACPLANRARVLAWQKANAERVNAKNAAWCAANPASCRAKRDRRRSAQLQRIPPWFGELDELVLLEAHDLGRRRREITGFAWDVDHTIPLRGERVSGLHVWNNVQVIPARLNRSKHNRFDHAEFGEVARIKVRPEMLG